jgi:hypothetical protein
VKAKDFRIAALPAPLNEFHVRTLTLNRLDQLRQYEQSGDAAGGSQRAGVALATLALCDADGEFLLDLDDVPLVKSKTPETIVAIANAAAEVQPAKADLDAEKKDSKPKRPTSSK